MVLAHTHCFEHACQQGQPASVAGCQWKQILIDSCDPRLTTMPGISHQSKMVNLEPNAKHVQLPLAPVWLELPIKTWPCAAGIVLSLLPSQGTTFVGTGLNEEKRELTTRLDVCHSYCHWRAKGLCSLPHPRTPTAGGWSGEMVPSGASSAGWTAAGWRSGSGSPGKQGRFPSHTKSVYQTGCKQSLLTLPLQVFATHVRAYLLYWREMKRPHGDHSCLSHHISLVIPHHLQSWTLQMYHTG